MLDVSCLNCNAPLVIVTNLGNITGLVEAAPAGRCIKIRRAPGTVHSYYLNSRLVMREIMEAGKPVPDPAGVPGALRWDVPGSIMLDSASSAGQRVATQGTWELVIDTRTSTVIHFMFKSK